RSCLCHSPPSFPTRRASALAQSTIGCDLAQSVDVIRLTRPREDDIDGVSASLQDCRSVDQMLRTFLQVKPAATRTHHQCHPRGRSEEHTSELQSRENHVCRT